MFFADVELSSISSLCSYPLRNNSFYDQSRLQSQLLLCALSDLLLLTVRHQAHSLTKHVTVLLLDWTSVTNTSVRLPFIGVFTLLGRHTNCILMIKF